MSTTDYCELCDLPRSQCIHGRPPPPEPTRAVAAAPRPRKAPVARTAAAKKAPAEAPARLRWTPPEVFKPLILSVLEEAGGELEADDLYQALESHAGDQLRDADHERTPEGELRWQYAARRARVALIAEGRMAKGRPGVWQLT